MGNPFLCIVIICYYGPPNMGSDTGITILAYEYLTGPPVSFKLQHSPIGAFGRYSGHLISESTIKIPTTMSGKRTGA